MEMWSAHISYFYTWSAHISYFYTYYFVLRLGLDVGIQVSHFSRF